DHEEEVKQVKRDRTVSVAGEGNAAKPEHVSKRTTAATVTPTPEELHEGREPEPETGVPDLPECMAHLPSYPLVHAIGRVLSEDSDAKGAPVLQFGAVVDPPSDLDLADIVAYGGDLGNGQPVIISDAFPPNAEVDELRNDDVLPKLCRAGAEPHAMQRRSFGIAQLDK
ncbi:unnamed protein product, partial [Durusdinium trenchii]